MDVNYSFKKIVTASRNEFQNKRTAKLCFIESIPYEKTEFWKDFGLTVSDSDQILIEHGGIGLRLSNTSGPSVFVDIIQLFDRNFTRRPTIMSRKTVAANWALGDTKLGQHFKCKQKLKSYKLEPGESPEFWYPNRHNLVKVPVFKTRRGIPSYLIVVRGASSATKIDVQLTNTIGFKLQNWKRTMSQASLK